MSFMSRLLSRKQRGGSKTKSASSMSLLETTTKSLLSRRQEKPLEVNELSLKIRETEALETLAEGVNTIATFLSSGGLGGALSLYARSQSIQSILGGLAAHGGRDALDARTMGQDALEITEKIEKVFDKLQERLENKMKRDPDIHNSESDYQEWKKRQ